jgi:DNA-binding SARP family transcriptional activator/tetratricopeptide (TPR) repeat protein
MKFQRVEILTELGDELTAGLFVLEAPAGYGKSWLIRQVISRNAVTIRNGFAAALRQVAVLSAAADASVPNILVDDAHLLTKPEVDDLLRLADDLEGRVRILLAGRMVDDRLIHLARICGAALTGQEGLGIGAAEIANETDLDLAVATQLVTASAGCVKVVDAALALRRGNAAANVVTAAVDMVHRQCRSAIRILAASDIGVVASLARTPNWPRSFVDVAESGSITRLVAAGVPLVRAPSDGLGLCWPDEFRQLSIPADIAQAASSLLEEFQQPLLGAELLLDNGDAAGAQAVLGRMFESAVEANDARAILRVLARLGLRVDDDPNLLCLRATALARIGTLESAASDLDRAADIVALSPDNHRLIRRIKVEHARVILRDGRRAVADEIAQAALIDIGPGEERTYARAHEVLAECAAASEHRIELLRAERFYRTASDAWTACGQFSYARSCRLALATGVLSTLGRVDDALAVLDELVATPGLSDSEMAWVMFGSGFVLINGGRPAEASERFDRAWALGQTMDQQRLLAACAWGRTIVAARCENADVARRFAMSAENLGVVEDDALGVPFLCDMATAFGSLGQLQLATDYQTRALRRGDVLPGMIALTSFILAARKGVVEDLERQLTQTSPAERWRVLLVSALAYANSGDLPLASRLRAESQRELASLGLPEAEMLGERQAVSTLVSLLDQVDLGANEQRGGTSTKPAVDGHDTYVKATDDRAYIYLQVIGPTISVLGGDPIPTGNPQRVLGVLAARGGAATIEEICDAMWPEAALDASRHRLRNLLLKLRRRDGEIVIRTSTGLRFADGVGCDLIDLLHFASDALASSRHDPDLGADLAAQAIDIADQGTPFSEFVYEDWSISARNRVDDVVLRLRDLLSVRAEDGGDFATAQYHAERALPLDRYSDSRYVRLAELHARQGRVAAALRTLDDATKAAGELGAEVSPHVVVRRSELLRQVSTGA